VRGRGVISAIRAVVVVATCVASRKLIDVSMILSPAVIWWS
jgi:hypothetical protein